VRRFARTIGFCLGLPLLAVGGFALIRSFLPDLGVVARIHDLVITVSVELSASGLPGVPSELPARMDSFFAHPAVLYGLAPGGLVLLAVAVLLGRAVKLPDHKQDDASAGRMEPTTAYVDPKLQKKGLRQAAALAKAGRNLEAAELCFENAAMDDAARYYLAAGELERVAEIYHDQNRFLESAELYFKAGKYESAGSIFSQQNEFLRAAESYEAAGNLSVAAEMFERSNQFLRAARAYETSGFPRHAAKAYVKCDRWEQAAKCLEEVIREEAPSVAGDAQKAAELKKLVMMAGNLYERAQQSDRAQTVLERGGCFGPAAEIAARCGRDEQAAALFLRARDVPRAADALRRLGQPQEAARHLAEYHRDRGEQELAAKHFEDAGELLSAGDLYRLLERYDKAGEVYERFGDDVQAAEMFGQAGDRARAAACYEKAGMYREAAECEALEGNEAREAELLARAGSFLRAGELHRAAGRADDAIKVLQELTPDHADFAAGSALLGGIFRERGMLPLAIKKLKHATAGQEMSRANIEAFYGLAVCLESNDQPVEATDLYEKILAFDYNYSDVAQRLEKTRALAQTRGAASASTPLSNSGKQGRYEITGTLGRGGMGIVYKAQDTVLDRTVAFKVLPESLKENPQALKNFLREAKSAAALNHPNIVTVFDAGEQDGVYYIAMEYVDGNTLKDIVKHRGKISAGGIVHVLAQLSEALAYAHDKKIVHRDIKTANAMWTRDRKAKIMDFGLAKVIEEVRNHTTVVSGTPYYMSPEQTLGKNIDHRTDIYSLGVSVFEMATGTLPFTEGNLPYHHVHTPPPDPREFNGEIPDFLAEIVLRCMAKDPADRFQSTREILAELKQRASQ